MKLVLIRHAESKGNAEGRIQGQLDIPLTERGRAQAEATARRLKRTSLCAVYSSPLSRALHTAEAIAAVQGLAPVILSDAQEYHFGEAAGFTFAELRERFQRPLDATGHTAASVPEYPGEEGRERFKERVCSAFQGVCEDHSADDAVAIVSHAGPIAVFLLDVLGLPYRRPVPLAIHNCSLSIVDIRDGRMVIEALNDTCHLEQG